MPSDTIAGYCLLSLPTDQIKPLSLLTLQGKNEANTTSATLGNIFIDSEIPLPLVSEDYLVSSNIDKSILVDLSVNSHLSLLEGLLKFLKLSAMFNVKKNKSVTVKMIEAKKSSVNEFEVDAFINSAKLNTTARGFAEMLKKNELFVVTDILKCKKYSIQSADEKTTDGAVEGSVPEAGDAGVSFRSAKASTDSSINEGEHYITIAVKAYRIKYVKDETTADESYRLRKDDTIHTMKGEEDFPGELMQQETIIVKD